MSVTKKDITLFLTLMENPKGSIDELHNMLKLRTKENKVIDQSTISRKIKKFFSDNIVYGVQGQIEGDRLDLERDVYLLEVDDTRWKSNKQILTSFFDSHPYTAFYNTIHGFYKGYYVEFYIPRKSQARKYIKAQISEMKQQKILKSFISIQNIEPYIGSQGYFEFWDPETENWKFSENSQKLMNYLETVYEPIKPVTKKSVLENLDIFDLSIIRELTKNSRRTQKEILDSIINPNKVILENGYDPYETIRDKFPKSKQTISRRFQEIESQGIIMTHRLSFDRISFGLFNQALFTMKNDVHGLTSLVEAIKAKIIPFPCALNANSDYLMFWIHCPPIQIIEISDILSSRFLNVQLSIFGRNPHAYFFYHLNYDPETKYWISDENYVKHQPMEVIR
jgi:DNA-binding Lrp family transcriptional regulator